MDEIPVERYEPHYKSEGRAADKTLLETWVALYGLNEGLPTEQKIEATDKAFKAALRAISPLK